MNLNNQKIIEDFPINNSVKKIEKLANELITISKISKQKYPFKLEYLKKMINKWEEFPNKYIIHLLDFPDNFIVEFNHKGITKLREVYDYFKLIGLDRLKRNYDINIYLIYNVLDSPNTKGLSVKFLRRLNNFVKQCKLQILDIFHLEKDVSKVKSGGRSKFLRLKNGLPLYINEDKWGAIFGVILDSYLKRFKFCSIDKNAIKDLNKYIKSIGITSKILKNKDIFYTGDHSLLSEILYLGGIDTKKIQVISNNSIPAWIFTNTSKNFQALLLGKIIETEGCAPNKNGIVRIAQSVKMDFSNQEKEIILTKSIPHFINKKKSVATYFQKVSESLKQKIIGNPPLILVSIQLLLRKNKINSGLIPLRITKGKRGIWTVYWHLNIINYKNIQRLFDFCNMFLISKRQGFISYLDGIERKILPNNLRFQYYLSNAYYIQQTKGYFTSKNLIERTQKKTKTIHNTVGVLAQKNFIQLNKMSNNQKEWKLTKKGLEVIEENYEGIIDLF